MAIIGLEKDKDKRSDTKERNRDSTSRQKEDGIDFKSIEAQSGEVSETGIQIQKQKSYTSLVGVFDVISKSVSNPLDLVIEVEFNRVGKGNRVYNIYPTSNNPYSLTPNVSVKEGDSIDIKFINKSSESMGGLVVLNHI